MAADPPRGGDIAKKLEAPPLFLRRGKGRHVQFRAFIAMLDPIALRVAHNRDAVFFGVHPEWKDAADFMASFSVGQGIYDSFLPGLLGGALL